MKFVGFFWQSSKAWLIEELHHLANITDKEEEQAGYKCICDGNILSSLLLEYFISTFEGQDISCDVELCIVTSRSIWFQDSSCAKASNV